MISIKNQRQWLNLTSSILFSSVQMASTTKLNKSETKSYSIRINELDSHAHSFHKHAKQITSQQHPIKSENIGTNFHDILLQEMFKQDENKR